MLTVALCDDERVFLEQEFKSVTKVLEKEYPDIEFEVLRFLSGSELVGNSENIDVFFLDIELDKEDGFEIAKQIISAQKDAKIVFVTSHENLVFDSFVFRPIGFIRKRLFEKEIEIVLSQIISSLVNENKVVIVGENKNTYTIFSSKISYIDTFGHYININMDGKKITVRDKISRIEAGLLKEDYVKVCRGCVVNLRYVRMLKNGDFYMKDGTIVKISRSNLKECEIRYRQFVGMR